MTLRASTLQPDDIDTRSTQRGTIGYLGATANKYQQDQMKNISKIQDKIHNVSQQLLATQYREEQRQKDQALFHIVRSLLLKEMHTTDEEKYVTFVTIEFFNKINSDSFLVLRR
jgi:hypothetical protein